MCQRPLGQARFGGRWSNQVSTMLREITTTYLSTAPNHSELFRSMVTCSPRHALLTSGSPSNCLPTVDEGGMAHQNVLKIVTSDRFCVLYVRVSSLLAVLSSLAVQQCWAVSCRWDEVANRTIEVSFRKLSQLRILMWKEFLLEKFLHSRPHFL